MKYLTIFLIPFLIIGCGKSEEEKKAEQALIQMAEMQKKTCQREAVSEALTILTKLKQPVANQLINYNNCKNFQITDNITTDYVNSLGIADDCDLAVTFKDSPCTPDLKDQMLHLTPKLTEEAILWQCSFSKKYDYKINFLPAVCQ